MPLLFCTFCRWFIEVKDCTKLDSTKIYYHDQRNFGTLRFCLSKDQLTKKLGSLGPDILDPETTEKDFLQVVSRQRAGLNVCKFLMDQAVCIGSCCDDKKRLLFVPFPSLISSVLILSMVPLNTKENCWCRQLYSL